MHAAVSWKERNRSESKLAQWRICAWAVQERNSIFFLFFRIEFYFFGGTSARRLASTACPPSPSQPSRGPVPSPRPTNKSIPSKHARIREKVNRSIICPRNGSGECALASALPSSDAPSLVWEGCNVEEGDTTPDLLLRHLDTTLTTYVQRQMKHLKHAFQTLKKNTWNTWKTIAIHT
jgi:hypothetical protein